MGGDSTGLGKGMAFSGIERRSLVLLLRDISGLESVGDCIGGDGRGGAEMNGLVKLVKILAVPPKAPRFCCIGSGIFGLGSR